jgi:hypothetical protein
MISTPKTAIPKNRHEKKQNSLSGRRSLKIQRILRVRQQSAEKCPPLHGTKISQSIKL